MARRQPLFRGLRPTDWRERANQGIMNLTIALKGANDDNNLMLELLERILTLEGIEKGNIGPSLNARVKFVVAKVKGELPIQGVKEVKVDERS